MDILITTLKLLTRESQPGSRFDIPANTECDVSTLFYIHYLLYMYAHA